MSCENASIGCASENRRIWISSCTSTSSRPSLGTLPCSKSGRHEMLPPLPPQNIADEMTAHAKLVPDSVLCESRSVKRRNANDLQRIEFRSAIYLAKMPSLASLGALVGIVVRFRPKEKVRGVDAMTHVATVQNIEASGNGAVVNLPTEAVSLHVSSISPKIPIARSDEAIGPKPALIGRGLDDLLPKSCFGGYCSQGHRAPSKPVDRGGAHQRSAPPFLI